MAARASGGAARAGAPPPQPAPREIRILAFGDSLTEGWTQGGRRFHPYAGRLQALLRSGDALGGGGGGDGGGGVVVDQMGVSGEMAADMRARLDSTLRRAAAGGAPSRYDWVCLLGGTNDAACGRGADEILSDLDAMHAAASSACARVLAMTLPPLCCALPEDARASLAAVNSGLRRRWGAAPAVATGGGAVVYDAPGGAAAPAGSVLVDLEPLLAPAALGPADAAALWDADGVHLAAAGYDRVADALFAALAPRLGAVGTGW
ncbi:MAG: SGNH hydrolase-type esterase domain-containing protein [Monoraphidium minutum]|nr:MAG: SGNH hydrolase-type esterase domain-containing protein [Monoraphidium minutum]